MCGRDISRSVWIVSAQLSSFRAVGTSLGLTSRPAALCSLLRLCLSACAFLQPLLGHKLFGFPWFPPCERDNRSMAYILCPDCGQRMRRFVMQVETQHSGARGRWRRGPARVHVVRPHWLVPHRALSSSLCLCALPFDVPLGPTSSWTTCCRRAVRPPCPASSPSATR